MEQDGLTLEDIRRFYALRGGVLACLANAMRGKVAAYDRQELWAASRYGDQARPAQAVRELRTTAEARRFTVVEEMKRASVPTPELDGKTMAVSGRVTLDGKSATGFTVASYDTEGRLSGNACVGERGVFVFEIEREMDFRLVVLDTEGKEREAGKEVYEYRRGETLYVNLALRSPDGSCVQPPDTHPTPNTFPMPRLVDMKEEDARAAIAKYGLAVGERREVYDAERGGLVVEHRPEPGAPVAAGNRVDLDIGRIFIFFPIPKLIGYSLGGARDALLKAGLTLGEVAFVQAKQSKGIQEQHPEAGVEVEAGAAITVVMPVTGALEGDNELIGDLFDIASEKEGAGIRGASVLDRLSKAGVKSVDDLRKLDHASDEAFGKMVGIITPKRLKAIRAALQSALNQIAKPG